MQTFEIVSALGRRKKPVAYLRYDEEAHSAEIEICADAQIYQVPAMFNGFLERGEYYIDADWTLSWISERVPPPSRHNISDILEGAGLDDYNPYELLIAAEGRCSQDDFFLREVSDSDSGEPRTAGERFEYSVVSMKESLGEMIARERKCAGLTQKELAYKAGIQQSMLSRLERGQVNPTIETLQCIANALEKDIEIRFTLHKFS